MSQISVEMCIKVKNPTVWKRFEKADDMGLGLARLAEEHVTTYISDEDDAVVYDNALEVIAEVLAPTLGDDGIIVGYWTDINVSPACYLCTGYFGDVVKDGGYSEEDEYFDEEGFDGERDDRPDIEDIAGWINCAFLKLNEREKEILEDFYILEIKKNGAKKFYDYSSNICMPDALLSEKWKRFKNNVCEKLDADLEKINKDDVKALVREWNASSIDEFIKNIWDSRGIWHDAFEWLGDSYEEVVNLVMSSYLTEEDLKDESKIDYIKLAEFLISE